MSATIRLAIDLPEGGALASTFVSARRALLRNLAAQVETAASDRARGAGGAPAGSYPIPARTGAFLRGFGLEVTDDYAIVFNDRLYAKALHDGYQPYGNTHAVPIPARPYFDDAMGDIDLRAAEAAWWEAISA